MTIAEFLLARIAEDEEAAARHLKTWANADDDVNNFDGAAAYLTPHRSLRHDSEYAAMRIGYGRVLAECAAKRAIIAFDQDHQVWCPRGISADTDAEAFVQGGPKDPQARHVTRMLATVYSDHPDYQQEWAV